MFKLEIKCDVSGNFDVAFVILYSPDFYFLRFSFISRSISRNDELALVGFLFVVQYIYNQLHWEKPAQRLPSSMERFDISSKHTRTHPLIEHDFGVRPTRLFDERQLFNTQHIIFTAFSSHRNTMLEMNE